MHVASGVFTFFCVAIYLISRLCSQDPPGWKHLFPWWGKEAKQVWQDICTVGRLRLPVRPAGGLAGLLQGLGLLLVFTMGILGITWFLIWSVFGNIQPLAHNIIGLHADLSTLLWIYVGGHSFMAIMHRIVSERFCEHYKR